MPKSKIVSSSLQSSQKLASHSIKEYLKLLKLGQPVELPPGYIEDYISKKPVKGTPEEVDAVQIFSRRLVEEYNYPPSAFKQDHSSRFTTNHLERRSIL